MGDARSPSDGRLHHGRENAIDTRSTVESNLRGFRRTASPSPQRGAAVAVVLLDNGGARCVPIFQRTADMRRHAGQMALPGGRMHEGESVEECAMRELREEIGLEVGAGDELGMLDDFDTRSGFTITPIVYWSDARAEDLRPSPAEVAQMFLPTTSELLNAAVIAGDGPAFSMRLPGVEVFAPTAAMLYQFAEVGLRGHEVRVADFYQPPWTHR